MRHDHHRSAEPAIGHARDAYPFITTQSLPTSPSTRKPLVPIWILPSVSSSNAGTDHQSVTGSSSRKKKTRCVLTSQPAPMRRSPNPIPSPSISSQERLNVPGTRRDPPSLLSCWHTPNPAASPPGYHLSEEPAHPKLLVVAGTADPPRPTTPTTKKPIVVAHQQARLDPLDEVQHHANHDQQTGPP